MDVCKLMRPVVRETPGYEAVEPLDQLARKLGIPVDRIIKLDGNENPYGSSPKVRTALAAFPSYHIYPDPFQREARRAVARYVRVDERHIVLGSGSDELLEVLLRVFVGSGDSVINCPPTFGMYSFLANVVGARVIDVPRREDFSLDLAAVKSASANAKILFLASPNNPTGDLTTLEDLLALLDTGRIVVVDEAYAEFAGESCVSWAPKRENLIVLRTFSKWAGLAGLRAGYGVFSEPVADAIMKIKQPYNLNAAAQAALLASLQDQKLLRERVRRIVAERERLFEALAAVPWLKPYPSQANFILCRVTQGAAKTVWSKLRERGIIVRRPDAPSLRESYLRISVGLPQHTEALIRALGEIGGEL